jgi:hypothetical protein
MCACRQTIVKIGSATPPTVPGVYMAVGAYEHDGITEVTLSANGYGTDCDPSGKSLDEQLNPAYCPINAIPGEGSDVDLNQQLIGNETGDGVIEVSGNDIPDAPPFPPHPPGFLHYGWKIVNGPFSGWYFIEWSDNGIHTGRCQYGCVPNGTRCTLPKYCRCDASSIIYPPLQFGRTATYECAEYLSCDSGTLTPQYFSCCSDRTPYSDGSSTQADCESNGHTWSTECSLYTHQNIVKLHSQCPPDVAGVKAFGGDVPGCTTEVALYKAITLEQYQAWDFTLGGYGAFAPINPAAVADGGDVDYAYKLECITPLDPTQID